MRPDPSPAELQRRIDWMAGLAARPDPPTPDPEPEPPRRNRIDRAVAAETRRLQAAAALRDEMRAAVAARARRLRERQQAWLTMNTETRAPSIRLKPPA